MRAGIIINNSSSARSPLTVWALNFWKVGPQFLESVGAPKKWPIWGGKKFLWTLPKKVHVGNGYKMCFLKKTGKKSVKFGLGGRSNISLPRIGGSHPVPSLSLLSTERRGTAMYYHSPTRVWCFLHNPTPRSQLSVRLSPFFTCIVD